MSEELAPGDESIITPRQPIKPRPAILEGDRVESKLLSPLYKLSRQQKYDKDELTRQKRADRAAADALARAAKPPAPPKLELCDLHSVASARQDFVMTDPVGDWTEPAFWADCVDPKAKHLRRFDRVELRQGKMILTLRVVSTDPIKRTAQVVEESRFLLPEPKCSIDESRAVTDGAGMTHATHTRVA